MVNNFKYDNLLLQIITFNGVIFLRLQITSLGLAIWRIRKTKPSILHQPNRQSFIIFFYEKGIK